MRANRSIMPKKEVAYINGLLIHTKRRIYSSVNKPVNVHSSIKNNWPYFLLILSMLSSITTIILAKINTRSATSKALPAGVFDS
jgi:hypothetical protein